MINVASNWFSLYLAQKADELERKRFAYFSKNNAFTKNTAIELSTSDKESLGINGESRFSTVKITFDKKYYYDKIVAKKIQEFIRLLIIISLIVVAVSIVIAIAPFILITVSQIGVFLLLLLKSPS